MEEVEKSGFDVWFERLCEYAESNNGRVPYKMAWLEFYDNGLSVEDAAKIGPYYLNN